MQIKKWVVNNQKTILLTLCAIVVVTSVLSTAFGTVAITRYVKNKKTVGVSAFLPGIISVLAGVIGIAAGFKANRWLIAIFAVIVVISMGLNIARSVEMCQNMGMNLSRMEIELQNQGMAKGSEEFNQANATVKNLLSIVHEFGVAISVIQALGFISSIALWFTIYIVRQPTSGYSLAGYI